jgi:hypothetical protein
LPDILGEYPAEVRARLVAYHYESASAGEAIEAAGLRVARPGECFPLPVALPPEQVVRLAASRRDQLLA